MRISVYSRAFLMITAALLLFPVSALSSKVLLTTISREAPPFQVTAIPGVPGRRISGSSQILLVGNIRRNSFDVRIFAFEKRKSRWQSAFAPIDGVIGRNGFAPPGEKREGDGRTPMGIFPLGMVFGYEPSLPTKMSYRQATYDDLWVDDVRADDYNQWVKRGTTKASTFERMRREDDLYKYGVVVEYNMNPVIKGYGSAIFLHLWRGRGMPTEGCVAMAEAELVRIIRWLDPEAKPLVVMGKSVTSGGFEK